MKVITSWSEIPHFETEEEEARSGLIRGSMCG